MRRVGFAAWVRETWEGPWPRHLHGIAVQPDFSRGCLSSGAHSQTLDYRAGHNGLANNGPDDRHTREYCGVWWETYNTGTGDEDMAVVIFINHKGKRYASYQGAGVKRHITSPRQESDIKYITEQSGGRVIEWAAGEDVGDPEAFGATI